MNIKRALHDAIMDLLMHNTIDGITIETIIMRAGISRATFYKYFRDKRELMMYSYNLFMDTNIFSESDGMTFEEMCINTLVFFKSNQKFFSNAFKSQGQNSCEVVIRNQSMALCEKLYKMGKRVETLTVEEEIRLEFYVAGTNEMLKQWVIRGAREPVHLIARLAYSCMPEPMREHIK